MESVFLSIIIFYFNIEFFLLSYKIIFNLYYILFIIVFYFILFRNWYVFYYYLIIEGFVMTGLMCGCCTLALLPAGTPFCKFRGRCEAEDTCTCVVGTDNTTTLCDDPVSGEFRNQWPLWDSSCDCVCSSVW